LFRLGLNNNYADEDGIVSESKTPSRYDGNGRKDVKQGS
jgi:hypothetical protein